MGGFGMGNNAEAHTSGVGLGVKDCEISGMYFSETGANAITFGGVQAEAHHPSDPAMVISGVVITENIFAGTSRTITSGSGILVTYATDTTITHNDLSDLPYSAICFGYGWGSNDVGGSPEYKDRGLYEYQPVYDTPTTLKSGLISGNLIHDYGRVHSDLGAVYTLSACPDTFIERNYIYGMVTSTGTGALKMLRYALVRYISDSLKQVSTTTKAPGISSIAIVSSTWRVPGIGDTWTRS